MNPALEYAFYIKKPGQDPERYVYDPVKMDWYGEFEAENPGISDFDRDAWMIPADLGYEDDDKDLSGTEIHLYNDTGNGPRTSRHFVASFDAVKIFEDQFCLGDAARDAISIYEGGQPDPHFQHYLKSGAVIKLNSQQQGKIK